MCSNKATRTLKGSSRSILARAGRSNYQPSYGQSNSDTEFSVSGHTSATPSSSLEVSANCFHQTQLMNDYSMFLLLLAILHLVCSAHYPQFYVIGAPKCATTSLHDFLTSQTEFCHSRQKEAHFFDDTTKYQEGYMYWRRAFVSDCRGPYLDSTPDYFASFEAPIRMHNDFSASFVPIVRFVVILREPVARSFSWYNHMMNHCVAHLTKVAAELENQKLQMPATGWNTTEFCGERHCAALQCQEKARFLCTGNEATSLATFAEYVASEAFPVEVGYYAQWLRHWLQFFPRHQILVVNFEQLLRDTPAVVHSITRFFGMRLPLKPNITLPHDNAARVPTALDCTARDRLHAHYAPHVRDLHALLRQTAYDRPRYERDFGTFGESLVCVE